MKKILSLLAAVCVTFSAAADEGMWLLPYLQKMNIKTMKERGCKLSAEEIYSVNHSSLKDAVVIFPDKDRLRSITVSLRKERGYAI